MLTVWQTAQKIIVKLFNFILEVFDQQILQFIIALNIFFYTVEYIKFWKLIWMYCVNIKILDWSKIAQLLKCCAVNVQKDALTELKTQIKVFIIFNEWSSSNYLAFLDITAYFIDIKWKYIEILLVFRELKSQYNDENLAEYILKMLKKWNLTH